jgi:formylglycine-generating enzyme required for sulfatase activity
VGLIYGPSGSGKSSLVKAGLLPRLSDAVIAVYVEAAAQATETRLLNALRKRLPALPVQPGLKETLAALRRGQGIPGGKRVLIVLDQFEQWLHSRRDEENARLVQALRQCDGARLQCIVMVRDDFWLAVSRFVRDLEVDLVPGRNIALVDLFDLDHARTVLAAFGRAFGKLPEKAHEMSKEQREFLSQAVSGLSQGNRVVCVRLAIFAEMMKGRPWTPATLKEVGGTEGVGVTFLEETFCAATANPRHRMHQHAARAVLKALLPESGSDIKGSLRPHAELLAASGYASRPAEFDDLVRILDGDLRLITPTDPEGAEGSPQAQGLQPAGLKYYQLTHDYLVPSLRDWLTRKQKETRRGRAQLLLADRSAVWNARPESRQLPSLPQWLGIRWLTRKKDWTPPQQRMMRRAFHYHLARGLAVVVALLLLLGAGWEAYGRVRAQTLRDNLLTAPTENVPAIVADMAPYRRWLDEPLRQARAQAEADGDARKQLHASLALLPVDDGQVEFLYERLLAAEPQDVIVLREALRPHAGALGERLWAVLEDAKADPRQRLRAACALAVYAEDDGRWQKVRDDVAARLVAENRFVIGQWAAALKPARRHLLPPLADLLLNEGHAGEARRTITGLYAGFAEGGDDAFVPLERILAEQAGAEASPEARLALVRRQANAAVTLAALGRWDKVWPLLPHTSDPTRRSYVIDRLGPGGAEARAVIDRLGSGREPDVSARRALLLALGEFDEDRLPPAERQALVPGLRASYRNDVDPGMRAAAGWLLRTWGHQKKAEGIDQELASNGKQRLEEIDREWARDPGACGPRWYVNGQRQTMVVLPPGEFQTEAAKGPGVKVRVEHRFALAAREVTVEEFLRLLPDYGYDTLKARHRDCPIISVTWYAAAAYCNLLSKMEGIDEAEWCYLPNADGKYAEGMTLKANALRLSGYRLPSDPEWEYACRAGSATTWSMGNAEDLLGKYARHFIPTAAEVSHPVGSLRPNDWGLFDMHGNALEWCHNRFDAFPVDLDQELAETVCDEVHRTLRGGAFVGPPAGTRSSDRSGYPPTIRFWDVGLRPARTIR